MYCLKLIICILFSVSVSTVNAQALTRDFPSGAHDVFIPQIEGVRSRLLHQIAPIVEKSINNGLYPGAIILASHHGKIIYRGVFGNRRILPEPAEMTLDTVFDLASLTKVVVTTTAIMQLVEQGQLELDMPVARYWPEFGHNGKNAITIRQLLTHTSGLPADVAIPRSDQVPTECSNHGVANNGKIKVLMAVANMRPLHPPGTVFTYSDVNFITLGYLVEIRSGEPLDQYANEHIFTPLGMEHTFFLPPRKLKDAIAPTQIIKGKLRWGEVHDDTAYLMGGVSGMAGLFSTASDLAIFADCLLNGGKIPAQHSKYLLGPLTILKMVSVQTPRTMADVHGLGWDIDTRYSNRGSLFPITSYGHTGWTGTSIWLDPTTQTWLIILTSRSHPTLPPINQLIQDRKAIANIVAGSITDIRITKLKNTGNGELARAYPDVSAN